MLKNRFAELAARAAGRGVWTYSEFLTLAEQDELIGMERSLPCPVALTGGLPAPERKIAVFGSEDFIGYPAAPPIVCLRISPLQQKFADSLTHRDFLGSLMALGIRREVLGDIEVLENVGYLMCLDTVSRYIMENLSEVRRTSVRCELTEPPAEVSALPGVSELVVASERLDAAVAAVYRLSRSQAQELISGEKVFISGRLARSASADIREGAVISVRGYGRFIYEGVSRETRKGRLRVRVRIFK